MHLGTHLPPEVELGATRSLRWNTEIVKTDGGYEVRNSRWSAPLRTFEIGFPPSTRDDDNYNAVIALYAEAEGGLHTFNFRDWTDESGYTVVKVRFDSDLEISGLAPHLDQIRGVVLVEVK